MKFQLAVNMLQTLTTVDTHSFADYGGSVVQSILYTNPPEMCSVSMITHVQSACHKRIASLSQQNKLKRPELSMLLYGKECNLVYNARKGLTSQGENTQFSPKASATAWPCDVGKSQSTTLAPFWTNLSTVALPRPEAPPVTSATLF